MLFTSSPSARKFFGLPNSAITTTLLAGVLVAGAGVPGANAAPVSPDVATINITLADPDPSHNTMSYLNASKDNKIAANISVEDPSGTYNVPEVTGGEIKGRGNYTWTLPKKPYQIKFAKDTALLGMEAQKTWILLANAADASLMRNKLAYDLAASLGMPFSPQSRFVDVRINGQYQGSYLATEKAEVKKNRVDLTDPQGVLAELDNNYGTQEDYYIYTAASKSVVTLKDAKSNIPGHAADGSVVKLPAQDKCADWIAATTTDPAKPGSGDQTCLGWYDMTATLNKLDSLLKPGNPDWNQISSIIDLDSFVNFYFVHELTENPEIVASSIYFYKNGPSDKLHAGNVWDFDSALGNYDKSESLGAFANSDYVKNASTLRKGVPNGSNPWFSDLFRNPQFVQRANEMWQQGIGAQVSKLPATIDSYRTQVQKSAASNFQKWAVLGKPTLLIPGEGKNYSSSFNGEVDYLKNWVSQRYAFLNTNYGSNPLVTDKAHVADLGWLNVVNNGQIAGTTGQSRRLEAFSLGLPNSPVSGSIEARSHVQNIGWSGWAGPSTVGTTGRGLRLEAFQLRLTGDLATKYQISYRAHVQEIGWQGWTTDGGTAGTQGLQRRIEAVQVRLLLKSQSGGAQTAYSAQVQNVGWMPTVYNGAIAGTVGKGLRLETLKLKVSNTNYSGDIQFCGHVQNIGWQSCVDSSGYIGTVGQGLRLEAFTIKLTGELAQQYRIKYQAHVQDIGWQPYVADGATAGTLGKSKRIEAVRIVLEPK